MKKNKLNKIYLACAALFLLIATLSSCNAESSNRFSTNPVTMKIEGHTFTFPQNYSMDRDSEGFSMTLLMPDFAPRTRENEKFLENPSYNKDIQIAVGSGNTTIPPSPYFSDPKENKESLERFLANSSTKYKAPKKVNQHLIYYEALSGHENITIEDLYVYHEDNDIQFTLECPAKISKSSLANLCVSSLNIFGNLSLKYWYPMQYLPDALATHNKIKNLLVAFHNGEIRK